MHATFFPSLSSTTIVPATAAGSSDAVLVTLTALVDNDEYEREVRRGGARLEVWTDVPCGGGDKEAEAAVQRGWRAIAFTEIDDDNDVHLDTTDDDISIRVTDTTDHSQSPVPTLRLSSIPIQPSNTHSKLPPHRTHRKFRTSLLVPRIPPRRYQFTYRVAFPTYTRWLGTAETNGYLDVRASDLGFEESPRTNLHEHWVAGCVKLNGGRSWSAPRDTISSDGVILGTLDVNNWDWKGWVVKKEGSIAPLSLPHSADNNDILVDNACLIYITPYHRQPTNAPAILSPRPIVLCTYTNQTDQPPLSTLSITAKGSVKVLYEAVTQDEFAIKNEDADVSVTVERRVHDIHSEDNVRTVLDTMRTTGARVLQSVELRESGEKLGSGAEYLGFVAKRRQDREPKNASGTEVESANFYIVPSIRRAHLQNEHRIRKLELSLSELVGGYDQVPALKLSLCLFCETTQSTLTLDPEVRSGKVQVLVNGNGGEFLVCPLYELNNPVHGSDTVIKVGIPSAPGFAEVITNTSLPTPPASPPPQTLSFAKSESLPQKTVTPPPPVPIEPTPVVATVIRKSAAVQTDPLPELTPVPTPKRVATPEPEPVLKASHSTSVVVPAQVGLRAELQQRVHDVFSKHPKTPHSSKSNALSQPPSHLPARIFAAISLMTWVTRVLLWGAWGVMTFPPVTVGRGVGWVGGLGLRIAGVAYKGLIKGGSKSGKRAEKKAEKKTETKTETKVDKQVERKEEKGVKKETVVQPMIPPKEDVNADEPPIAAPTPIPALVLEPVPVPVETIETQPRPSSPAPSFVAKSDVTEKTNPPPYSENIAYPTPSTPSPIPIRATSPILSKALMWRLPANYYDEEKVKKIRVLVSHPQAASEDVEVDFDTLLQIELNGCPVGPVVGKQVVDGGVVVVDYALPSMSTTVLSGNDRLLVKMN